MSSAHGSEAVELAERARALVQAKPLHARALAEEALELARRQRDNEGRVAALHALGFARYALGDPGALRTMQAAVRAGEHGGYLERAALARRNLALYLAYGGRTQRAVREIETARASLSGLERARTEVFRIAIYEMAGRAREALPGTTASLRVLHRRGDLTWEARLLYNRGTALAELGEARAARRDLERARNLYAALGLEAAVADAQIALARLRYIEADVIGCLIELGTIDTAELSDWAACWLVLFRAEAFVGLRLLPEARSDLRRFVEASTRAEAVDSVNKGRLEAAQLALLAGDPVTAGSLAATARRSFAARGQTSFAAAATLLSLAAALKVGSVRPSQIRAARNAVAILSATGSMLAALRGQLLVARALAAAASPLQAERQLAAARPLERRGSVADRIELRHVKALGRLAAGDPAGAERSLRNGLRLLEDYRAALGAVELRATASGIGAELSRQGLEIALVAGKPAKVLAWAERLRGNALRLPLVRPPADAQLRAQQTELRRVAGQLRETEAEGRPPRGLAARQAELEETIRARTRNVRGVGKVPASAVPDRRRAACALGERTLVEYVELDGVMRALTLAGNRLTLHELGADEASAELEWLRFALGRLARRGNSAGQRAAAIGNARVAAAALDRLLVEPLLPTLGDAHLVIVPTGALHALPWATLPSLSGRPFVVAPSLSAWLALAGRSRSRPAMTTLIAGPRLRHSAAEVDEIASLHPRSTVLTGNAATVAAALGALEGATLAHIACHGRFRSDSPLFSSLELVDGPLTALDLQRLRRPPDVLVLSSCSLALSDRHPGDELLGMSAALLAMGTRTIVASVVPVPDAAARRLMLAFHKQLAGGASPASALALAQADLRTRSTALAGFVCIGSG